MFQMITASFLAVAVMADTHHFLKFILIKKSRSGVDSLRFSIALAAFLSAIFILVLPFCILENIILPPVFLLSGDIRVCPKCNEHYRAAFRMELVATHYRSLPMLLREKPSVGFRNKASPTEF